MLKHDTLGGHQVNHQALLSYLYKFIKTQISKPFEYAQGCWTLDLKFTLVNGLNYKAIKMNEH
jgi:hypothetical protein